METKWSNIIDENYKSGVSNVFLLTGTVHDYVAPGVSLRNFLVNHYQENTIQMCSYSIATGTTIIHGPFLEKQTHGRNDWEEMLIDLRTVREEGRIIYLIEYPEFVLGHNVSGQVDKETSNRLIGLHQLMNDTAFINSNNMLLLVSETKSGIHEMFLNANSRTIIVPVDYPDREERMDMIAYLRATSKKPFDSELSDGVLANLTAGLSRMQMEDLHLLAESSGKMTRNMVIDRKEELIRKEFGELIEFFDTEGFGLSQFSGQEHIKKYHEEAVIEPFKNGNTAYVPKGLLYMGPPGTGKTYFARCLAGDAGINFVEFKMSKIVDKWVGTSERNLEKAFNCFLSMAPVGVFIDEMDQVLSRGGDNDSNPVRQNIFGMFLAFLSKPENRGKILWVGATNYPNKIDEALKRAGRFDKKIPFFAPDSNDRISVLRHHVKASGFASTLIEADLEELAEGMDGFTPAEIENIVVKANELIHRRGLSGMTRAVMDEAIGYMLPASNSRIQEMTDLALKDTNDLEFLTGDYKERALELHQKH
ncbi:ATP-binding protein [Psychrobacillus sp. FSL H8-0510]|uniref:ATP-binding protein n=1 Tax=Psychrobacillus sp. FSL H8-0510 TaxID=2921394 RepID=UPI0030FA5AA9